jgi:hypothetical protein
MDCALSVLVDAESKDPEDASSARSFQGILLTVRIPVDARAEEIFVDRFWVKLLDAAWQEK